MSFGQSNVINSKTRKLNLNLQKERCFSHVEFLPFKLKDSHRNETYAKNQTSCNGRKRIEIGVFKVKLIKADDGNEDDHISSSEIGDLVPSTIRPLYDIT